MSGPRLHKLLTLNETLPSQKWCDTSINLPIDPFFGGRTALANICAIGILLYNACSFNIPINSQIDGCVCLNMVGNECAIVPNCYMLANVFLSADYAYFTTREGILAANGSPFGTLECD